MKLFIKFFLLLLIFITPNLAKTEDRIVFINIEKIMTDSKAGKSISKQLEKIHKNNISKFKKMETQLKESEEKIVAQNNILSKEDFQKKITELRDEAATYRKERSESINSLTKKRLEATGQLINVINPILAEYSEKNSISMIIQKKNIVIGKKDSDITDEILKLVDQKITKIKLD